ncbi:MAG: FkbM family methyltransferase [Chitinophagaceae bacterium]|nr:FkbM family methyltransferase [Chitinophagaceae bacterium]
MNSGLASLFFASKNYVEKVYAFEPFISTVEIAKGNFELNPHLSKKISISNSGISNRNAIITVPLFQEGSLEASVNEDFIKHHNFSSIENKATIIIQLKDIITIIDEITEIEKICDNKKLILKIDCEGEEYNIIERLSESNYFNKISVFLIEWHHKGPDSIVRTLKENDFKILLCPITTLDGNIIEEAGMIYAFK